MSVSGHLPRFFVKQKVTMMVNRYEVRAVAPDGSEGELIALAQQKRVAAKEQVTFYSDEARQHPAFGFKARKRIDLGSGYDVTDADGQQIAHFKKDFGSSLMRSTFLVEGPGYAGRGQERSAVVAVARRFVDLPFRFHMDFVDDAGAPLLSIQRKASLRDHYDVTVPDERVDVRVAAALAVAVDALLAR